MVITEERSLAIVPKDTEEADIVCILWGCSVPVILRPHDGNYEFIGECYVNGITAVMDGHAADEARAVKYDIVGLFPNDALSAW